MATRSARPEHEVLVSYNPATGAAVGEVPLLGEAELKEVLDRARRAQLGWAQRPLAERCAIIGRFATLLEERGDEAARLLVSENGKPYQEAFGHDIVNVIDLAAFYSRRALKVLAPEKLWLHLYMHKASELVYVPRGVVLVIAPWNFPLAIPTGSVIFGLLAGNSVVLKPASLTPLIAFKIRELLLEAGVPEEVFQVVACKGSHASKMIEMGVDYVNFTGSTDIGVKVAETCARRMIPYSMELGGKHPAIVCADADLERVANGLTWGAFCNSGQVCASVERALVHRSVYERLCTMITERVGALRQGDPGAAEVEIGAMTDPGQIDVVAAQVDQARQRGARILTGGVRPTGPGQFYPPTAIATDDTSLDVFREESFGPLLPILPFDDEEQAIRMANDSKYGLTASVWTRDIERGRRIAERIEAGTVMINDVIFTHSAPETPWFGAKMSGTGVVHSDEGLRGMARMVHINYPRVTLGKREPFWFPYSRRTTSFLRSVARAAASGNLRAWGETILAFVR